MSTSCLDIAGESIYGRLYGSAIAEAKKGYKKVAFHRFRSRDGQVLAEDTSVQDGDPVTHAEIDCLRNAGRIGKYKDTTLYSTLMPCYLCAGAVVQFGIKKVIAGESQTFLERESLWSRTGLR